MQKTTTYLNKTVQNIKGLNTTKNIELQPKESTIKNILDFAATYRVQSINKDQFVDLLLN